MNAKHCGASVSEVLAHAYVSGDAPSAALLAPSLVSVSLSVAWRNDNSSGSRTRFLLFQCDLSPTWGYIRQRCSLCRCRLLYESIPKLAALQPPWPLEQFGHVNNLEYYGNYLKRYIETRNDMRYVRTYGRTPYAQTNLQLNTLVWGSLTLAQIHTLILYNMVIPNNSHEYTTRTPRIYYKADQTLSSHIHNEQPYRQSLGDTTQDQEPTNNSKTVSATKITNRLEVELVESTLPIDTISAEHRRFRQHKS